MSKQVLVVDDEIGALTLIGIMLERGGFDVIKAQDAYTAIDVLKASSPDLIIMDVMMPGMNGIDLCRKVREAPETQEVPVIILSARGDAASVEAGISAGANDYLSKPILHHDLITKIRDVLNIEEA